MPDEAEQARQYRAYLISPAGHIIKPLDISASTDPEAIEQARQYVDGHAVELWERSRKIAFFPAKSSSDCARALDLVALLS